jgi:hypothetical protein
MSRFVRIPLLIVLTALAAVVTAGAANPAAPVGRRAASVLPQLQSRYVQMPDGVRLAVDIWLPVGTTAGARLRTVLEADRYWGAWAYTGVSRTTGTTTSRRRGTRAGMRMCLPTCAAPVPRSAR